MVNLVISTDGGRTSGQTDQRLNGVVYNTTYIGYENFSPFNNLYEVKVTGWTSGADTSGQDVVIADYVGFSNIQNGRLWPVTLIETSALNGASATAENGWQGTIKSIYVPPTVREIRSNALSVSSLTTVTGMTGVTKIEQWAFRFTKLTEFTFYNIDNLGSGIFDYVNTLQKIYVLINQNAQYVITNFRDKRVLGTFDSQNNSTFFSNPTFYKYSTVEAPLTSDWNGSIFHKDYYSSPISFTLQDFVLSPTNIVASQTTPTNAVGANATVNVTFTDGVDSTIQWQVSTNDGTSWADITDAIAATSSIPYLSAYNGLVAKARAVLTFNGSTYNSNEVTLTQPPYSLTFTEGANKAYYIEDDAEFFYDYSGNRTGVTMELQFKVDDGAWNLANESLTVQSITNGFNVVYNDTLPFNNSNKLRVKLTYNGAVLTSNEIDFVRKPILIVAQNPDEALGTNYQLITDISGQTFTFTATVPNASPDLLYAWQYTYDGENWNWFDREFTLAADNGHILQHTFDLTNSELYSDTDAVIQTGGTYKNSSAFTAKYKYNNVRCLTTMNQYVSQELYTPSDNNGQISFKPSFIGFVEDSTNHSVKINVPEAYRKYVTVQWFASTSQNSPIDYNNFTPTVEFNSEASQQVYEIQSSRPYGMPAINLIKVNGGEPSLLSQNMYIDNNYSEIAAAYYWQPYITFSTPDNSLSGYNVVTDLAYTPARQLLPLVYPITYVYFIEGGNTIEVGSNITLTAAINGGSESLPITYQWYKESVAPENAIPDASTNTITITNAQEADSAVYIITAKNSDNIDAAVAYTTVYVLPPIEITSQPDNQVTSEGGSVTFTANVAGGQFSYMWYRDNGDDLVNDADVVIDGEYNSQLTISNVNLSHVGKYYFKATELNGTILTSQMASLHVMASIRQQPASVTILSGNSHTFSPIVGGESTGMMYQWQKNGVDISGATDATYTIEPVRAVNAGTYTLKVKNSYNSDWVISDPAVLHVAANIITQPQSVLVDPYAPAPASATVVADGEGPIYYKWEKLNYGYWEQQQLGENLTLFSFNNDNNHHGDYRVQVYNDYNLDSPVISNTISYHSKAKVNDSNMVYYLQGGRTITLDYTMIGNGSFKFSMYIDGELTGLSANLYKGESTTPELSFDSFGELYTDTYNWTAGDYKIVAYNAYSVDSPDIYTFTVHINGAVLSQPAGGNVGVASASETTQLTVSMAGETTITWYQLPSGGELSMPTTVGNSTTLNAAPGYSYYAVVQGYNMADVTTATTTVYVLQSPTGVQAAQNKYVMVGDQITLSAPSMTGSNLQYSWSYDDVPEMAVGPGVPTKDITADSSMFDKSYSVTITNTNDSLTTTQVFNIVEALKITTQPESQNIPYGSSKVLSVVAVKGDPDATLTYQWTRNTVPISDATSSSYTATEDGDYAVTVSLSNSSVTLSASATLTSVLGIATQPPAIVTIQHGSASGTVTGPVAGGVEGITYTWYKKGTPDTEVQAEGSAPDLALSGPITVENGTAGVYYCVVSAGGETILSTDTSVHVGAAITAQPEPATVTKSVSKADALMDHEFVVGASGEKIAFQWYTKPVGTDDSSYTPIHGARSANYLKTGLAVSDAGVYRVKIMDEYSASFYSSTQTLRIQPTIMTQPAATTVAFNATTTFTVDASGESTLAYQWYGPAGALTNDSGIAGATSAQLTVAATNISRAGGYYVVVSRTPTLPELPSITSSTVRLNISPAITSAPGTVIAVAGSTATITVDASGEDLQYQWYKGSVSEANMLTNDSKLSGVTTKTLSIVDVQAADAAQYVVRVSGSYLPAVDSTATLKVGPNIITETDNASKFLGETATFSIAAQGAGLTYQWYKDSASNTTATLNASALNGPLETTTDDSALANVANRIEGATTNTLTIKNIMIGDAAKYYVLVTGESGTVQAYSSPSRLNIKANIKTQPVTKTFTEGTNSNNFLTFALQGEQSLGSFPYYNIQWYRKLVDETEYSPITLDTAGKFYVLNNGGALFVVRDPLVSDAGMYKFEVWNGYNIDEKIMSDEVRINIAPRITTNLVNKTVYVGEQNVALTVSANGELPMSFTWKKGGSIITSSESEWEIVTSTANGAGTSTMTLKRPFAVTDVNFIYMADISNNYATVTSAGIWIRPKATLKEHLAYGGSIFGSDFGVVPYIVQYGVAPTAKLTLDTYYNASAQANVVYYTTDMNDENKSDESALFVDTTSFANQSQYLSRFTLNLTATHVNTLATASSSGTKKVHVRVYVNDTYTNPYAGDMTQFSDVLIDFAASFTTDSGNMRPQVGSNVWLTYSIDNVGSALTSYKFYKNGTELIQGSKYTVSFLPANAQYSQPDRVQLQINSIAMSDIDEKYYAVISNGKVPTGAADEFVKSTERNLHIIPLIQNVSYTSTPLFIGDNFNLTVTVSGELPMEYRFYDREATNIPNAFDVYGSLSTELEYKRITNGSTIGQLNMTINDAYQQYGYMVLNAYKSFPSGGTSVPVVKARVATLAYWPDSRSGSNVKRYGNNVKSSAAAEVIYFDVNTGTSTTAIAGLSGANAGKSIIKLQSNPGVKSIKWQRAVGSTDGTGSWEDVTNSSVGFAGQLASFPTADVQNDNTADITTLTNYALPAFTVDSTTAGAYRMVMTQTRGHVLGNFRDSQFYGPTLCFRIIPIIQLPLPPTRNLVKVGDVASFTIRATNMTNIIWKRTKDNGVTFETLVSQLGTNVGTGNRYTNSVNGLVGTLSFTVQDSDEGYTYYAHPANVAAPNGIPNTAGTEFHIPASIKSFRPDEINKFIGELGEFAVEIYGAKQNIRYQWKKNGQNIGSWTTQERLTFPAIKFNDAGFYSVVVENIHTAEYKRDFAGFEQESLHKQLRIKSAIVSHNLYNRKLIVGAPLTLNVVGEGSTITYQWFKGDDTIGTNSPTLSVSSSGVYRCEVTSDGNTSASPVANIQFVSLIDNSADAFEAILAGNIFPGIPMALNYNGHAFSIMKKNFLNDATTATFAPSGAPAITADLQNVANAGSMVLLVDQNIADDGINKSIMTHIELFDTNGIKVSNSLPAGSSVKMTWTLPPDLANLSTENLVVQRLSNDESMVLQTIPLIRNADGTLSSVHTGFSPNRITSTIVPCFPAGTRVLTAAGYKAVEELTADDKMVTADGRAVAFNRYTTHIAKTTAATAPYRVAAGAFGRNVPATAVCLSPLHAIQSRKGIWQIPKYAALSNAGIQQYGVGEAVDYYHIELPNYFTDNIVAEGGAVVESFAHKQTKGLKNVYKYNATLGGFTRVSAKISAKK